MTDIHCEKRQCLNNRQGWCKANAIRLDGVCRSYAPPNTMMRKKCQGKITRQNRRYKNFEAEILK